MIMHNFDKKLKYKSNDAHYKTVENSENKKKSQRNSLLINCHI